MTLYVGENLSYDQEKIFHDKAENLTEYHGDALSVVTAYNENARPLPAVHGIEMKNFKGKGADDKGRGTDRVSFQTSSV